MERGNRFASYPSLKDRIVIVTGGATGIGEFIVEAFAEQGSQVFFLDIDKESAVALSERLDGSTHKPQFIFCDLTSVDALQAAIGGLIDGFGAADVLVNNAGNDTRHDFLSVNQDFWDSMIAVNLRQQFFAAQAVVPAMQRAQHGSIINMSSIGWMIPSTQQAVYVTAKAAIIGTTRTLAHELGKNNIRVNSVMPGAVLTDRQKRLWLTETYTAQVLANQALKRMVLPEDVARLVLFLASDDSAAITNQSHVIDAGWI
jgi:NAD(P)-dependent dehydrogenase (short-subunit alcohol dehydrogenase family)